MTDEQWWALGFVIMTQNLKFISEQGYSHYFDDPEFRGGEKNRDKKYLGVANLV